MALREECPIYPLRYGGIAPTSFPPCIHFLITWVAKLWRKSYTRGHPSLGKSIPACFAQARNRSPCHSAVIGLPVCVRWKKNSLSGKLRDARLSYFWHSPQRSHDIGTSRSLCALESAMYKVPACRSTSEGHTQRYIRDCPVLPTKYALPSLCFL